MLPGEGDVKDSSETTETKPTEAATASPGDADRMAELEAMVKRQAERLAASEAAREKAEIESAEAKERVASLAKAQANRSRNQPMLTSEILRGRPQASPQVEESSRRKVHASSVRLAKGKDLGECDRVLCAPNLFDSGRCEVHVTLPDHARTETSKDAYVAVFEDGYARVPGGVAEILLAQGRYQQVN